MTTDALAFPLISCEEASGCELKGKTDLELARLSAAGDMGAFEELYFRHHGRTYSLVLRMVQNTHLAEDLTQEVYIQLYRKIGGFRGNSAFTTWLHRLTVNLVLMHFRKKSVRMERTVSEEEDAYRLGEDQIVLGTENPFKLSIDDRIALVRAIDQLPNGYRNVFILHDIEGYEHHEVGRILNFSEGTSKSQLHKARLKLQKLLTKRTNPRLHGVLDLGGAP